MKDHISVSQINLYMACSLKYKFAYIDELPKPFKPAGLAFGIAIHSAIEWFHKQRFEGVKVKASHLLEIFEADWQAVNTDHVLYKNGETTKSLLGLGFSLLQIYFANSNGNKILKVESAFETALIEPKTKQRLELPLAGRFDLIEEGPVIVDLKTAARKCSQSDADANLQLTGYSYVYYLKTGTLPDLRLDVLLKTKSPKLEKLSTSRTIQDFRAFFLLAKQILKGIRSNVFFPNPSWRCTDCEYKNVCWMFRGAST